MSEQTYTLDEARAELARRECAEHGHQWSVTQTMTRPVAIHCDTCGLRYSVRPEAVGS